MFLQTVKNQWIQDTIKNVIVPSLEICFIIYLQFFLPYVDEVMLYGTREVWDFPNIPTIKGTFMMEINKVYPYITMHTTHIN